MLKSITRFVPMLLPSRWRPMPERVVIRSPRLMEAIHRHEQVIGLTREALLSRGVRVAGAFAVGGAGVGALAADAQAETLPDNDLAYLRLVIASELLAIDFYTRAVAARKYKANAPTLRKALADEKAHYTALTKELTAAGQTATTAADIDFTYPRGSFVSRASIARLGVRLEGIFVGVALGAAAGLQTEALRLQVAQIAASESRHLATFAFLTGRSPVGPAFPASLSLDRATSALSAFES
jgi:rubrerythrin